MHGDIKKFNFKPRTLDDSSVRDGLEAVSVLNEKEPYFLVGGIASQSYLPTSCRRPTSDIDFALVRPLYKSDFREFVAPVQEFLQDKGYETELKTRNRSRSYALNFTNKDGETLCLEFARRSEENFNKNREMLERELDYSRKKIVEGRDSVYSVACPEDIVVPKLLRLINSLERNPEFMNYVPPKLQSLSEEAVKERIDMINEFREEAVSNPGDPYLAGKLRFISDIYDIRILSELTGFNESYFSRSEKDWRDIAEKPELRNKIFEVSLPLVFNRSLEAIR